ncbi:hypothetical protein KCU88_g170, partial [Aureobasidium melanogenum]
MNFDPIKYSIGSSLLPPHAAPCGIRSFLGEPQRSAIRMLAQKHDILIEITVVPPPSTVISTTTAAYISGPKT